MTGQSLNLYKMPSIELDLYESNDLGLPAVYNQSINKAKSDPAILIFMHDDVLLTDIFWVSSLFEGLKQFQLVGVAGNRTRLPFQPGWAYGEKPANVDTSDFLTGAVGHGDKFPPLILSKFGPVGLEAKLLDGVFLACYSETLLENQIFFDEIFDFHFYDVDFCRQCEYKGIRMGTWPISIVHGSTGNFRSSQWERNKDLYFSKWGS